MPLLRDGDPTNTPCPKCKAEILYNGNYFCSECDWSAPDRWLERNPRAYANLMDWRSKRWKIAVEDLTNFNRQLYDRGKK